MSGPYITLHINPNAKRQIEQICFEAVREVFELDIKPEAVELSPVSTTWPSIPASRGEKRRDAGTNRRSIDTEVTRVSNGIQGQIFTQSGHGGYLEVGTSRMPARPYIYPTFVKYQDKFAEVIGLKVSQAR